MIHRVALALCAALLALACGPAAAPPGASPTAASPQATATEGSQVSAAEQALNDLIARARQETKLTVTVPSAAAPVVPDIAAAFKRRFGLENLDLNVDATGGESGKVREALAAHRAGAPQAFDVLEAGENQLLNLDKEGGLLETENWELLLSAINPLVESGSVSAEMVSPAAFSGRAFVFSNRAYALVYNTNLISAQDLPKTYAELADPKYQGKFAMSQFTSMWLFGPLVYDKQEWLDMAERIGRNATVVGNPDSLTERMLLGEYPLVPNDSDSYYSTKRRDPNARIGITFMTDFSGMQSILYTATKGTRSPASATLFALWMTTEESASIRQPLDAQPNLVYPTTAFDREVQDLIAKSGAEPITWIDTPESVELLNWYGSEEGSEYADQLTRALTQRR